MYLECRICYLATNIMIWMNNEWLLFDKVCFLWWAASSPFLILIGLVDTHKESIVSDDWPKGHLILSSMKTIHCKNSNTQE